MGSDIYDYVSNCGGSIWTKWLACQYQSVSWKHLKKLGKLLII